MYTHTQTPVCLRCPLSPAPPLLTEAILCVAAMCMCACVRALALIHSWACMHVHGQQPFALCTYGMVQKHALYCLHVCRV